MGSIPHALKIFIKQPFRNVSKISSLSDSEGWSYGSLINDLEAKRKGKNADDLRTGKFKVQKINTVKHSASVEKNALIHIRGVKEKMNIYQQRHIDNSKKIKTNFDPKINMYLKETRVQKEENRAWCNHFAFDCMRYSYEILHDRSKMSLRVPRMIN